MVRAAWGCDETSPLLDHERFVYDLGGVETMRCPMALMRQPYVQTALDLYADYQQGITPRGRGIRRETAAYRNSMRALSNLASEAENWYARESKAKRKGG